VKDYSVEKGFAHFFLAETILRDCHDGNCNGVEAIQTRQIVSPYVAILDRLHSLKMDHQL
jgi:hypothetical protein